MRKQGTRKVDMTKKSNIKCEHCDYYNVLIEKCVLTMEHKNYWNRCKNFEWGADIKKKAKMKGVQE